MSTPSKPKKLKIATDGATATTTPKPPATPAKEPKKLKLAGDGATATTTPAKEPLVDFNLLIPQELNRRMVTEWLKEDIPSFDCGGWVVGNKPEEATLYCESSLCVCAIMTYQPHFCRQGRGRDGWGSVLQRSV